MPELPAERAVRSPQTNEYVVAPEKYTRRCVRYKHGDGPIRAVPGAAAPPSLGAPVSVPTGSTAFLRPKASA